MENKPTHLIIPIERIEKIKRELNLKIDNKDYPDEETYIIYRSRVNLINEFLHTSKQVSLDEESIREKATNLNGNAYWAQGHFMGYTQAIKDLLL